MGGWGEGPERCGKRGLSAGLSGAPAALPAQAACVCGSALQRLENRRGSALRGLENRRAPDIAAACCVPPSRPRKQVGRCLNLLKVMDEKVVVVLDPDETVGNKKDYLDAKRSKEKRYVFDIALEGTTTNEQCYARTVGELSGSVLNGLNSTVFAYGATGSGKTHTMVGSHQDPGLMVLALKDVFNKLKNAPSGYNWKVSCQYIEVYNECIYDLLHPNTTHRSSQSLELRENPEEGVTVSGVTKVEVDSANHILDLLRQGNARRRTEATDANATSSRSHAVLTIQVARTEANKYRAKVLHGKLSLVDLAGSERASETNNRGSKLKDGANINRSLLALANCINALGKQHKKGMAYVPYRNSKLTRMLKDGLSGNSRTAMIATVSCSSDQYHHTTNTLKYADRAKEIKTHVQTNVGTVESHIADYQRMIDNLQREVYELKTELKDKDPVPKPSRGPGAPGGAGVEEEPDSELSWLDALSNDININVEARINLQKALFELEDTNVQNKSEMMQIDEAVAEAERNGAGQGAPELVELAERRADVVENVRENEETGERIRADIEANEAARRALQAKIDEAMKSDRNKTFLHILSQYRLQGVMNMELQLQMAIRDQIIEDQKEVIGNLWKVLECSGLDRQRILEIAHEQGIGIQVDAADGESEVGTPLLQQQGVPGARAMARREMLDPSAAGDVGGHSGAAAAAAKVIRQASGVSGSVGAGVGGASTTSSMVGASPESPKEGAPPAVSSPKGDGVLQASGSSVGSKLTRPGSASESVSRRGADGGENVPPSGERSRQGVGVSLCVPDLMVVNGNNGGSSGGAEAPRGNDGVRGSAPLAAPRGAKGAASNGGRFRSLSLLKGNRGAGRSRAKTNN